MNQHILAVTVLFLPALDVLVIDRSLFHTKCIIFASDTRIANGIIFLYCSRIPEMFYSFW